MKNSNVLIIICLSAIFLYCSCNSVFQKAKPEPITGILGAFDKEVEMLESQLADKQEVRIEGIRFAEGRLCGRKVVIALTGFGKVNAAMTTTLFIEHFRPNEVIFTGIAGALNPGVSIGDVIIAERTAQHDSGVLKTGGLEYEGVTNPISSKQNPVFFNADKRLLELPSKPLRKQNSKQSG